jgi:DNA-binding MarR family transcriptional regulator
MREATDAASGHGAAAPAALVGLLRFRDGCSMDELADMVGLTPSGAVRLVDRLVAAGQLRRRPGTDARSVAIELTGRGRTAAHRIADARAETIEAVLDPLTPAERADLARLHAKLLTRVTTDRLAARQRGTPPPAGWLCRLCDPDACGRPRGSCPALAARP